MDREAAILPKYEGLRISRTQKTLFVRAELIIGRFPPNSVSSVRSSEKSPVFRKIRYLESVRTQPACRLSVRRAQEEQNLFRVVRPRVDTHLPPLPSLES